MEPHADLHAVFFGQNNEKMFAKLLQFINIFYIIEKNQINNIIINSRRNNDRFIKRC